MAAYRAVISEARQPYNYQFYATTVDSSPNLAFCSWSFQKQSSKVILHALLNWPSADRTLERLSITSGHKLYKTVSNENETEVGVTFKYVSRDSRKFYVVR